MKRIIIALIIILCPLIAPAQITVNKGASLKVEQLTSARMGMFRLCRIGEDYYMIIPSTNPYEDGISVDLGVGKESALQTLRDLVSLYDTLKDGEFVTFSVDMGTHKPSFTVTRGLLGAMRFSQSYSAGVYETSKAELAKCVRALER